MGESSLSFGKPPVGFSVRVSSDGIPSRAAVASRAKASRASRSRSSRSSSSTLLRRSSAVTLTAPPSKRDCLTLVDPPRREEPAASEDDALADSRWRDPEAPGVAVNGGRREDVEVGRGGWGGWDGGEVEVLEEEDETE